MFGQMQCVLPYRRRQRIDLAQVVEQRLRRLVAQLERTVEGAQVVKRAHRECVLVVLVQPGFMAVIQIVA
ncbi:hypothetical protein D3C84_1265700 [compost metagenome]